MQKKLFGQSIENEAKMPLAEKLRPKNLDEFIGHDELTGKDGIIKKLIIKDTIPSMIFWGPAGVGKTTLARIISNETKSKFIQISAVMAGKNDLREVIKIAKEISQFETDRKTILFIDEIHRFNKAQQDYLLPFVENGTIILIGATTENPSFEVISPLLSRTRVFTLKRHNLKELKRILKRALKYLKKIGIIIEFKRNAIEYLLNKSNKDPRSMLNVLELAIDLSKRDDSKKIYISQKILVKVLQSNLLYYDKNGEEHYNIISALHKSMRSSNPNAAVYWIARMLEAGEDPLYIARRMLRFSAEDIGNSDPQAVILANTVFDACKKIGMPECSVFLSQLAIYLSKAPKDNSAYIAYDEAQKDAKKTLNLTVPMHLRNAPTKLMKEKGYGKGYEYDHNLKSKKSNQECFPDELKGRKYI